MKVYLRTFLFLLVLTAVTGYLVYSLFPGLEKESLLYLSNKQYKKALKNYQELFKDENPSISVASTLSELYLKQAKIDKAIDTWESYVQENPTSKEALRYLLKLYENTGKQRLYTETLKKIFTIDPTQKEGRTLLFHLSFYALQDESFQVLNKLDELGPLTPEESMHLARLQETRDDDMAAYKTIVKMFTTHSPETIEWEPLSYGLTILEQHGEEDLLYRIVLQWVDKAKNPSATRDYVEFLAKHRYFDKAKTLIRALGPELQYHPSTLASYEYIYQEEGKPRLAYQMFKRAYQKGKLPDESASDFFHLALLYEEDEKAMAEIVRNTRPSLVSDEYLLALLQRAIQRNEPSIAKALLDASNEPLKPYIAIGAAVAAEKHPTLEGLDYYSLLDTSSITSSREKAELAYLFFLKGYDEIAAKELASLTSLEKIEGGDLYRIITIFDKVGLQNEALALIDQKSSPAAIAAKALLFTSLGYEARAYKLIEDTPIPYDYLVDIAYTAKEKGAYRLLFAAAKVLDKKPAAPSLTLLIADAYLHGGLIELAKKKLHTLLSNKHAGLSEKIHAAFLLKDPELLDELIAKQKPLSQTNRLQYAYYLTELGAYKKAEVLYTEAAMRASVSSQVMQDLFSVWKKGNLAPRFDFIAERFKEDPEDLRHLWLKLLLDYEYSDELLALVKPEDLQNEAVADLFMTALADLEKYEELKGAIAMVLPGTTDLKRLEKIGKMAYYASLQEQADEVYSKLLAINPDNLEGLKFGGIVAFSRGRYTAASKLFSRYLARYRPDYYVDYYSGQLAEMAYNQKCAYAFFCRALRQIQTVERSQDTERTKASLYDHLGQVRIAYQLLDKLVCKDPSSLSLKASYAFLLLKCGQIRDTAALLCLKVKKSPKINIEWMLAKIELLIKSGQYGRGVCVNENLLRQFPRDTELLENRANLELLQGRWRRAIRYLSMAHAIAPQNEGICREKEEILRLYPASAIAMQEHINSPLSEMQNITRFDFHTYFDLFHSLRVQLECNRTLVYNETNIATGENLREEKTVYRYLFHWLYAYASDDTISANLYVTDTSIGGGISALLIDPKGSWEAIVQYKYPNWDYSVSIVNEGVRDKIQIMRQQRLHPQLIVFATPSINRYSLKGITAAATTFKCEGGVSFLFHPLWLPYSLFGQNSELSLNYFLDFETALRTRVRFSPLFNEPFAPFAINQRTNHTCSFLLSRRFCEFVLFEAYGGYLFNSSAGGSAIAVGGAKIQWGNPRCLRFFANYDHSPSVDGNTVISDTVKIGLQHDF